MNKQKFYDWWFLKIGFCACGNPSEVVKLIRDTLANPKMVEWSPFHLFVLYSLDAWNLTEHGVGVAYSWLTPEGQDMYDFLASLTDDDIDTLLNDDDENGVPR